MAVIRRIGSVGLARLAAAVWLVGTAAHAASSMDQTVPIDVVAQSLGESLRSLAKQANLQILFDPQLVAGRASRPFKGRLSPRTALRELLRGTGLEATEQAPGVIVIRRSERAP